MYKHNIYTKPGLIGFGGYQGLGAVKNQTIMAGKQAGSNTTIRTTTPEPTGLDALPTWAYIAIPVGVVAVAAVVYYKFF